MKRKLLAGLLCFCLMIGLLPTSISANGTGSGLTADDPMMVAAEHLVIKNDTYYGISKDWFEDINPEKAKLYFAISIPDNVTTIAENGFRDNYTSAKKNNGAVTSNDGIGGYSIVSIDFSQAKHLTTIKSQAAYGCDLSGVLDLSNTRVATLEKSAFNGCDGLTGVVLPKTLKVLGANDGTSGSVFNGCTGLQFVRTAEGDPEAVFELPDGLEVIGKQTFKSTFPKGSDLKITIPASVKIIGSEAFYSNSCFSQIYIEREEDYSGYDSGAFKAASTSDCLLILPNDTAYGNTGSFSRITKTYPVTLSFENGGSTHTEKKLYGQSIKYTLGEDGIWYLDENYTLPDVGNVEAKPGYDAGWKIEGDTKVLTDSSKVSGWTEGTLTVTIVNDAVVSKPAVDYVANGEIVEQSTTGVPEINVQVSENNPGTVGVQVVHPLATEEAKESGTYVYFKYCWWDESGEQGGVNGPRSEEEPELFSSSITSINLQRVFTDSNTIPIRDANDARTDGEYYLVEIYGYYVENGGSPQQFYKSNHNFIGVGSDGTHGEGFVFNVNVEELESITLKPVNLTAYMGGDGGYDHVVADGSETTVSTSLPHPLFQITGVDNAEGMVFSYGEKSWTVVEDGNGYYHFAEGAPVRVTYTNNKTHKTTLSDEFEIKDVGDVFNTYTVALYTGEVDLSKVTATLGNNSYAVATGTGTLTVRAVEADDPTSEVVEGSAPTSAVAAGSATAVVPANTTYTLNGLEGVTIPDDAKPSLLFDEIIESDGVKRTEALKAAVDKELGSSTNRNYEYKYLDLVDANNGNAWIKANNPVAIYWGIPTENVNDDTEFTILHFKGLHRDGDKSGFEVEDVNSATIETITPERTEYGLKFEVAPGGFSPYVLVWETEKDNPPYIPDPDPTPDPDEPDTPDVPDVDLPDDLNTVDHFSYVVGYEDGTVMPQKQITRAEVATIFYRLLEDEVRDEYDTTVNDFSDVSADSWYNQTVSTLASMEIVKGYEDGTFRPNASITRAEFAAIATRFFEETGATYEPGTFTDVTGDEWFAGAIMDAVNLGLIGGYEDGTVRPNNNITRAEACAIVNRTLGRVPDADHLLPADEMTTWPDNPSSAWFYADMQEATNGHEYEWITEDGNKIEEWTDILDKDWNDR